MSHHEILSRIANGDLHTTPKYSTGSVPESDYRANHERFQELSKILDLMGDKYITGDKDETKEKPFYKNLRLTESGKERLRFGSLTLKDIDNAHGKDSAKEWLGKPLLLEVCKYLVLALLALIGGVYSTEIKEIFSPAQKIEQEKTINNQNKTPAP